MPPRLPGNRGAWSAGFVRSQGSLNIISAGVGTLKAEETVVAILVCIIHQCIDKSLKFWYGLWVFGVGFNLLEGIKAVKMSMKFTLWSKYLLPFTCTMRSLETSEETDLQNQESQISQNLNCIKQQQQDYILFMNSCS